MATKYLDQLVELTSSLFPKKLIGIKLESKHFFSGAALYANGKIFITLTPKGLAIKLPENTLKKLFKEKKAKPLRYFKKAPIKKEYVLLSKKSTNDMKLVKKLAQLSMDFAVSLK